MNANVHFLRRLLRPRQGATEEEEEEEEEEEQQTHQSRKLWR